jgi:phosphatidylglycerophosphate synthase
MGAASPIPTHAAASRPTPPATRALIDARGKGPWRVVGGIPLVTRLVRSLELEGVQTIDVLCDTLQPAETLGARRKGTRAESVVLAPGRSPAQALAERARGDLVLAVDGCLVVDRRLLRALLAERTPTVVPPQPEDPHIGLALLDAVSASRFGARPSPADPVARLLPERLPTFSDEMRGETPILYRAARAPDAARVAERALVTATQKHVMDAPARWLDPPIENAIVTKLAPTRVTPNQVTIGCTLLGFVTAWLLWHGAFALALPLMYLVGWLDGVDGKLARLRLHYSPLGAEESYFDFAYENAWWIALAAHLTCVGHAQAVGWGIALVGGNLLDEIAYTIGHTRLDVALDLLSPADGAFRLIAGRRNIYAAILLVATLLGSPYGGLVAMGAWAVFTGVVHALRLAVALWTPSRSGLHA